MEPTTGPNLGLQEIPQLAVLFEDVKQDGKTPLANIRKGFEDLIFLIDELQKQNLPRALAESKSNAEVASKLLAKDFADGTHEVEQLKGKNGMNLPMMNTLKGLESQLRESFAEIQTFQERSKTLVDLIGQASEEVRLECLFVTALQDLPATLGKLYQDTQDLKKETAKERNLVGPNVLWDWKTKFTQFTERQKQIHAIKKLEGQAPQLSPLQECFKELDGEILKKPTKPEYCAVNGEYVKNCKAVKEKCIRYWNAILGNLMIIEMRLFIIDCSNMAPPDRIKAYTEGFETFRTDVLHVRNVYRGNADDVKAEVGQEKKVEEQTLSGNHEFLKKQFQTHEQTFALQIAERKNLKDTILRLQTQGKIMIERFSKLDAQALESPEQPLKGFSTELTQLLNEFVKKPLTEVETYFSQILTQMEPKWKEVAVGMNRAESVVDNPEWQGKAFYSLTSTGGVFPSPTLFQATQYLESWTGTPQYYAKYNKFTKQLED